MISPIIVANPAGEYVMSNWVAYSSAINSCKYFNKLFNGNSIVMDRHTYNYIDYNKYNSLPIFFDIDYNMDLFGLINIHSLDVLCDYSKRYNENTFILSTNPIFRIYLDNHSDIYLLISEKLAGTFGDEEGEYIDFSKWMRKNSPIYQDDISAVYRFVNMQHVFALYSEILKRPLYSYERELIVKLYTSDECTVRVPYYFPLVKI